MTFQQSDVGLSQLGQMIGGTGAGDSTSNDDNFEVTGRGQRAKSPIPRTASAIWRWKCRVPASQ